MCAPLIGLTGCPLVIRASGPCLLFPGHYWTVFSFLFLSSSPTAPLLWQFYITKQETHALFRCSPCNCTLSYQGKILGPSVVFVQESRTSRNRQSDFREFWLQVFSAVPVGALEAAMQQGTSHLYTLEAAKWQIIWEYYGDRRALRTQGDSEQWAPTKCLLWMLLGVKHF